MTRDSMINQLRVFHFVSGVLSNQQNDPLCSKCLSFAKSVETVTNNFIRFKTVFAAEKSSFSEDSRELFADVSEKLTYIRQPEEPVGQKKAGNCKLPEGVCLPKVAAAVFEKIGG